MTWAYLVGAAIPIAAVLLLNRPEAKRRRRNTRALMAAARADREDCPLCGHLPSLHGEHGCTVCRCTTPAIRLSPPL